MSTQFRHIAVVRLIFDRITSWQWAGTPVTPTLGHVHANFVFFLHLLVFELSPKGTAGRMSKTRSNWMAAR